MGVIFSFGNLHKAFLPLKDEDPRQRGALETELAALELLLERSGGVNHHEVVLLDRRIERVREQLADS